LFRPILRRAALGLVAICAVSAGLILPAQRAAAQDSCVQDDSGQYICRWTQLDNNDWPVNTTDPDCHNVCDWYLHGNCQYLWYSNNVSNSSGSIDFRGDMKRAIEAWNGRPYCSPTFYDCNCGSAFLTITAADLSASNPGVCGLGWVTSAWDAGGQAGDNHIVSAEAEYNEKPPAQWTQGDVSYRHCDAIGVSIHEVGHAMGEGHSSYRADIMCSIPGADPTDPNQGCQDVTAIDADADSMLNAVYGPYHDNSNGNCGGCQMACPQTSGISQTSTGTDPATMVNQFVWTVCGTAFALPDVSGYWAKTWDLLQGVSTPDLPEEITGSSCWPWFAQKQLVPWINCEAGVDVP